MHLRPSLFTLCDPQLFSPVREERSSLQFGRLRSLAFALLFAVLGIVPAAFAQTPSVTTLALTAGGVAVTTVPSKTVVALTATVTANGAPARPGQVNFCDTSPHCTDIHLLGTAQVTSAGTAVMKLAPGAGVHNYRAVFRGTNSMATSSSSSVTVTVGLSNTPTIQAGGSPGNYTIKSIVTGNGPSPPTGTVSFLDTNNANYLLASAPLVPVPGTSLPGVNYLLDLYTVGTVGVPPSPPPPAAPCMPNTVPATCLYNTLVVGDFNGDGNLDVALANSAITILLGDGNGSFTMPKPNAPVAGSAAISIAVADFNQDGIPDIVMTQTSAGLSYTYILPGVGDGTFTQGQIINGVGSTPYVGVGDFNGDGIPDLVLSGGGTLAFGATILLGKGDGTFTMKSSYNTGVSSPPAIGDFNGDGTADIVMAGPGNTVTLLLGNGDGTFKTAPQIPLTALGLPSSITAGDFNGDGALDLAVMNGSPDPNPPPRPPLPQPIAYQTILKGNGDGTFTQLSEGQVTVQGGDFEVGDFNGDGIPDLFMAAVGAGSSLGANQVMIQIGVGDGSFRAPLPPFIGAFGSADRVGDFNNDGLVDLVSPDLSGVAVLIDEPAMYSAIATVNGVSIVGMGMHQIDASYSGDNNFASGVSPTLGLTAEPVPTTLTMAVNPTTIIQFQPVTLTVNLTPNTAQNHNASGPVTFTSGSTVLGTADVVAGVAMLNTTSFLGGSNNIVASYAGDTNFLPSTATTTVAITVLPVDFTIALASPNLTVQTQHHITTTINFTSINGFVDPLTLACVNPPTFITCQFTPQPVTLPASGTATVSLYIDTDKVVGFARNDPAPRPLRPLLPPTGLALSLCAGLAASRRRLHGLRSRVLLMALAAVPIALTLTGCSEIILPPPSVTPGTYTIPITATASAHPITHTATLTLTVTP
jgi:FG-GAP-like repeat/Bacterial Ig-like domain (group 3)